MKQVRYMLVDDQRIPVENYHQDDSSDPLVAPSLHRLVDEIAEWTDMDMRGVLKSMNPDGTLVLDGITHTIIREEFEVLDLTDGDIAALEKLREENGLTRDDTRRGETVDEEDDVDELHRLGIYDEN